MSTTAIASTTDHLSPLWVVTSYYNPAGYQRRLQNFTLFRQFLDVPLLVVELSSGADFALDKSCDGDIVLQLVGEDRLWQKERLINIGVKALPAHVKYVAWIDCDVIFLDPDWSQQTLEKLQADNVILQLFNRAYHVDKHFIESTELQKECSDVDKLRKDSVLIESSVVPVWQTADQNSDFDPNKHHARGASIDNLTDSDEYQPAFGIAWAAPRRFFEQVGLYDGSIMGGGDDFILAGYNKTVSALSQRFVHSASHSHHAQVWGNKFADCRNSYSISYLNGGLIHLWHGIFSNRQYLERQQLLTNFDPYRDLQTADSGAWQWRNPQGEIAQNVAEYFYQRKEDG